MLRCLGVSELGSADGTLGAVLGLPEPVVAAGPMKDVVTWKWPDDVFISDDLEADGTACACLVSHFCLRSGRLGKLDSKGGGSHYQEL